MAGRVDALYFFLLAISTFFSVLIAGLIVFYAIRYRRRDPLSVGEVLHGMMALEIGWTVIPFIISMVIFVWGASVFFAISRPPDETLNIYVVGKQWMWKFQHLDGQREINELHVPVGRPVKLIMTSEDVIHDVFVPAFRVKADVIPGRYTNLWFQPTKPGRYHLFCAEYCGTRHSGMTGEVIVMEPSEFQTWLSGGAPEGSLASAGKIGTPVDALLLYCYHYDPMTGRYGLVIMRAIRMAGAATVLAIGAFIVVMLRRERRAEPGAGASGTLAPGTLAPGTRHPFRGIR